MLRSSIRPQVDSTATSKVIEVRCESFEQGRHELGILVPEGWDLLRVIVDR